MALQVANMTMAARFEAAISKPLVKLAHLSSRPGAVRVAVWGPLTVERIAYLPQRNRDPVSGLHLVPS